jgi:pyridinium-3,5-bisthiocarboxylic acid mononucleotide nickel chelatase
MLLGALIDLGLPLDRLREALGSLAVEYGSISADRVLRSGISATKFRAHAAGQRPDPHHHGSDHLHHHSHSHHSLKEIEAAIGRSALSAAARERALGLFQRLAETEAAIHQVPVERIHLHEVGAVDSIIDIVGAVHGLEWLGADEVVASPLNVGSGRVACAHGTYPVPAPATARLLEGVPVYAAGPATELTTPTGALLVTGYARSYGPLPPMRVDRIGYGAGDKDFPNHPNVLRMLLGSTDTAGTEERIVALECEIDDMNPQLFGPLMDRLYAAGAHDVFYAAVQMKKNRPGTLVTVIAPPGRREQIAGVLFAETTTIGLRYQEMRRERLDRDVIGVETPLGEIRFKVARRGGRVVNAAPEFEDCARAAAERGVPIKDVQAQAMKAWLERPRPERDA